MSVNYSMALLISHSYELIGSAPYFIFPKWALISQATKLVYFRDVTVSI